MRNKNCHKGKGTSNWARAGRPTISLANSDGNRKKARTLVLLGARACFLHPGLMGASPVAFFSPRSVAFILQLCRLHRDARRKRPAPPLLLAVEHVCAVTYTVFLFIHLLLNSNCLFTACFLARAEGKGVEVEACH